MKFFFPDSQDLVDPSFDFVSESRSEDRIRQRDDLYAHEVFDAPPYDGLLVSRAVVEGNGGAAGRYTLAQRRRFLVRGVREFLRIPDGVEVMGDCGAFSYVNEPTPPVTVDEVVEFYDGAGFDLGASVDHVVLQYSPAWDRALPGIDPVPPACRDRQEITLELAKTFFDISGAGKYRFRPLGVAQGWSPASYAYAVSSLQKIGYRHIALGGLVPLKSPEILEVLNAVSAVRHPESRLHLFGVTRLEHVRRFAGLGVTSFDSTSPLRQAFKEDRDNYYGKSRTYVAIRVPQVGVNAKLKKKILAGELDQREALRLEQACLDALIRFDANATDRSDLVGLLCEYRRLFDLKRDYSNDYDILLRDRPWDDCRCSVCRALGIHVVIFRGAERNRRRGFHNVYVTWQRLRELRSAGVNA